MTASGQDEFKYGRSTPVLTSNGKDEFKFGRSTPILASSGQDEFKLADLPIDMSPDLPPSY